MLEHRFTWTLIAATFLLLIVGGTVNPTGSSLACPEPTLICKGSLFPEMTGGVLYEHGHRLVAMTVGILQIVLTVLLWRRRPGVAPGQAGRDPRHRWGRPPNPPALRWLGVAALALVSAQGALGAITVEYKLPWTVSTSHLLMAMVYLATLLTIAWRTGSGSDAARSLEPGARSPIGSARTWIGVAAAAVLLQILLGGLMRHHGGALASVDLPLHEGSVWPAGAPLALKLHMAHRIGGILVGLVGLVAACVVFRRAAGWKRLRLLAVLVPIVVVAQVALGVLTIASLRSVPVAVAHFGGAAMLWGLWCSMWLMTGTVRPTPREPVFVGGGFGR